MSQITLPLPNRALAVVKKPFAPPAAFVFSVLIFLVLAVGLAWWQGPGLWRDWQINQNPLTVEDWDLRDGECSSRRGLTDCEADVVYTHQGQDYEKHISLAFFDLSSSDYMVELVIARDNPELATLSLGLDMIWNRLITFGVFILLFGGLLIATIVGALQVAGANRAAANPARLSLVPVEIAEVKQGRGGVMVAYNYLRNGKARRNARTQFAKGQEPLIGLDENGHPVGVAVRMEGMNMPILLDDNLNRIELTESERQSALAAYHAEQEQRGSVVADAPAPKKKGPSILRGLMAAGGVLVLAVVAFFGFWLYYVMAAPDAFDPIGIEINNIMPEPLNNWGCEQLYQRFGDERAPYGCVSSEDWTSWRVAPKSGKVK